MWIVETEQEVDGRWIAEVAELPGVLAYGVSKAEAVEHAPFLALRVLAERIEHREDVPEKCA
jgi:predicted RNase H-like HicB family nuclease